MDTYEQFRDSERRTTRLRLAVAALALAAGAFWPSGAAGPLVAVALAAAYATFIGVLKLRLLSRFRSDAWIFGMMAVDLVFATAALLAFGPLGPALALPVFMTAYYALFLGYRGAVSAAAVGILAVAIAGLSTDAGPALSLATAVPLLAAVAAMSGYLARERFSERDRRLRSAVEVRDEARAQRALAGLLSVASATSQQEWADAVAASIPRTVGFPAVLVFLRPLGGERLDMVSANIDGSEQAAADNVRLAAEAMRSGAARALQRDELPKGLRGAGYESGALAPLASKGRTAGAVCVYAKDSATPAVRDLEQLELFLGLATSFLLALRDGGAGRVPGNRFSLELRDAGRKLGVAARPIVDINGVRLDPASERSTVRGMSIPLSRSEFDLLYALAAAPGTVLSVAALQAATGRARGSGAAKGVDVTVHRLRRKLRRCPGGESLVTTVRGKGYTLATSAAPDGADKPSDLHADSTTRGVERRGRPIQGV